MTALFGWGLTPQQQLKKTTRELKNATRKLERERTSLERTETKLKGDIKKSAQKGQMEVAKIQAKDLVRTRKDIARFYTIASRMNVIQLRLETHSANEQMMKSMKSASVALEKMNAATSIPALLKHFQQFEMQNEMLSQKQEMMGEVLDDGMDEGLEIEEESNEEIAKTLAEIGVDMNSQVSYSESCTIDARTGANSTQFGETPTGLPPTAAPEARVAQAVGGGGGNDDDGLESFEARMASLRK